jgi:hypothetical protein
MQRDRLIATPILQLSPAVTSLASDDPQSTFWCKLGEGMLQIPVKFSWSERRKSWKVAQENQVALQLNKKIGGTCQLDRLLNSELFL